jgi:outer membrane receptor for ferrienterochelin and colicins
LSSFGFYQRDKITYRKNLVDLLSEVIPTQEANSSTSFLNFMSRGTYNKITSKVFNYQFGYDVNVNSAFGTRIVSEKGKMNDFAVFSCFEYKPNKYFTLKPGVRATYNTIYPAPFVPSIQFQYSRFKNLTMKYAYGRGFRAPSLKELFLDFVDFNHNITGNENLKSEMSDNQNLTFKYKWKHKSKKVSFIDLAFFHNSIYNQIAIVAVSPIDLTYTYQNIDNFYSKGASLNVSSKIKDLRYTLGASYIGVYNNAFDVLNNNKFLYSPELRAQLSYLLKIKDKDPVSVSLFYKYNGVMNGFAFNETRDIVPTKIAAFNILDVTANKTFWDKKLSLTLGLKNLLNITNVLATGNTSVHSGGSSSMPISVGRSLFVQLLLKI